MHCTIKTTIIIDNVLASKLTEMISAVSKALDQIATWHAKKNNVVFRLNNFKEEYSDSHANTTPAPHMAETKLSIAVICVIRRGW